MLSEIEGPSNEENSSLTERAVENLLRNALAVLAAPNLTAPISAFAVNPRYTFQDNQCVCGVARRLAPLFLPAFTR